MKTFKQFVEQENMGCPKATQDLGLNTKNRNKAIQTDYIQYGPLNVDEPGDYWKDIADFWNTSVEAAQKSNCGNCVAFDISLRMKDCMPGKTSDEDGELGYCWMHHFKCHSARSCRTWAKGGPITKDDTSYDWQKKSDLSEQSELEEGSESWEDGYERRVVKTHLKRHKEDGYNWRIKGKDKDNLTIKLYKKKPDFEEFKKQMRRVAGHEFGG